MRRDEILEATELLRRPDARVTLRGDKSVRNRGVMKRLALIPALLVSLGALNTTQIGVGAALGLSAGATGQAILVEPVALDPIPTLDPVSVSGVKTRAAFEVTDDMTREQVAHKLLENGKPFQALAVTLEGMETKPYRDGCGLNVGMGYCIDARVREYGEDRVKEDLAGAGLEQLQIDALMGKDRAAQDKIEMTRTQALSLLELTEGDYRTRARDIVGQGVFDKLPEHRQAALTWLSYNTGEGLAKFSNLLRNVRNDKPEEAVKHMTPFFSQGGKMVPNSRAGAWMMAAYWSEDALKAAIERPDALEVGARQGQSPIAIVAPQEAGRMAMAGTLPASPYVVHSQAKLEAPAAAATAQLAPAPTSPLGGSQPTTIQLEGGATATGSPMALEAWRQARERAKDHPQPSEPGAPTRSGLKR